MTDSEYRRMSYIIGLMKGMIDSVISSQAIAENTRDRIRTMMARDVDPVLGDLFYRPRQPVQAEQIQERRIDLEMPAPTRPSRPAINPTAVRVQHSL